MQTGEDETTASAAQPSQQASHDASPEVTHTRAFRNKRLMHRIGIAASLVLFAVSVGVLIYIIRELDIEEVKAAYNRTSWRQIAMALGIKKGIDLLANRGKDPAQMTPTERAAAAKTQQTACEAV